MLTSKEQTFPTTGIAGGFLKLKRTIKGGLITSKPPFADAFFEMTLNYTYVSYHSSQSF
ncbi:hypothetical protein CLNEO_28660 [Anaerotignum neopropionicum]|uniref:Uncharacterized protein n=1 Tax=Anaerotignum neopropionicum TaxID=36847 RepID=A0A136WBU1_9FIRM|nr:hypothetical protein [Anaerotignum neopropionicum]KXL51799.1 hypothetical protein CLNEO_28660 [Anaerotignum neopropionicum]